MNESSDPKNILAIGEHPLVKAGLPSSDFKSFGIMQVTLTTAQDLDPAATPALLNNPEYSVKLAAIYLSRLMKMFPENRRKIIMSYNQGPGNTKRGVEAAAPYYDKFVRGLNRVLQLQPGSELELT